MLAAFFPTVVTFGAAISATERAAKWPEALLLLEDLGRRGLQPNVILCSSAVSACEKAGLLLRGLIYSLL